jgi:tetratricopeptide (TPR) repeat protein
MPSCLSVRRLLLAVLLVALTGCATYSDSFSVIKRDLSTRHYDAALLEIEKQSKSTTDRVLYFLNKGMVLRMKRDFAGSNEALEAAKTEMDRLYAASVTENTLSIIVNDATVSYAGDDYEQVLVHLYMALNYLELGLTNEARVEALQIDVTSRAFADKRPENRFAEDALSRYLTGLIYEDLGEWSDALIAYRKAYEAYKKYSANYHVTMPEMLKIDLVRMAQRQGLDDEVAQYRKEFNLPPPPSADAPTTQDGELVFILNSGLAPIKRSHTLTILANGSRSSGQAGGSAGTMPISVSIALPYYESQPNRVIGARVSAQGRQAATQTMENIDAIARASLDARMPAITARTAARAVTKAILEKSVDQAASGNRDNNLAAVGSILVRVAAVATERADTRSWLTLPASVQLARLPQPPGTHDVNIDLLGAGGQVIASLAYSGIVIKPQRKTFVTQHWVADDRGAAVPVTDQVIITK